MRRLLFLLPLCLVLSASAGNQVVYGPNFQTLAPSADSSVSGWTLVGVASHYDAINDAPDATGQATGDGDTTALECPTGTVCADVLDLTNTSGLSGKKILYVGTSHVQKKISGAGFTQFVVAIRVGGVNYTTQNPSFSSTSYATVSTGTRYYTNPATSAAWTTTDLDALQISLDRVTGSKVARMTAVTVVVAYEDAETPISTTRERSGGGD